MPLKYLLDTNTVSYLLSGREPRVRLRMERAGFAATSISAVTEAELRYGLAKKQPSIRLRIAVETFLAQAAILPWDSAAAAAYGLLRAGQERKGRPLSAEDLMIAAQASRPRIFVCRRLAHGRLDGGVTQSRRFRCAQSPRRM
jgi:tRNA(fMet)-specific endonuclease VapC